MPSCLSELPDESRRGTRPVVLVKLMFLLFHEKVRSERELVTRASP